MLGGDRGFFHGLSEETGASVINELVDACFDLAELFHQHPEAFMVLPVDELGFYASTVARMAKRREREKG